MNQNIYRKEAFYSSILVNSINESLNNIIKFINCIYH